MSNDPAVWNAEYQAEAIKTAECIRQGRWASYGEDYRRQLLLADALMHTVSLVDTTCAETISEVVRYLESEGHGIPAEKVRVTFDAPAGSDCDCPAEEANAWVLAPLPRKTSERGQ